MFSLETFCGNVTGKILFDVVNEKVFSVFDANKFVGVCTDGANVMTGKNEGFIGQLNKNGISGRHFHCIIHQVALASKFLSGHPVMKRAEQIINEIRGGHHSLTHRKFVNFLKTTSARHNDLKMYTDIRWLSRGDCLNRLFELREEVLQFLEINCNEDTLVRSLKDDNSILDLAFLADVTFFLNKLNLKLQGKETGINDAVKNVHQFQTELFLLLRELQSGDYAHFPKTSLIITKHEGVKPSDHIAILEQLFNNFEDRFQDFVCFQPFLDIFENPFKCDISKYEFAIQSELIILQSENVPPHGDNIEFWKNLEESLYPILKRISYQCLSLFPTTYFCEKIFSDLKFICSKQRHSLTSSHLSNVLLLRSCHESIHIKDFIRDII